MTLVFASGGLAALGFAASGAVALAAVALGLKNRRGRRRGNRFGRRGRSTNNVINPQRKSDFYEENAELEMLMEEIGAEDISGCGGLLVCELAAKPAEQLAPYQKNILDVVG